MNIKEHTPIVVKGQDDHLDQESVSIQKQNQDPVATQPGEGHKTQLFMTDTTINKLSQQQEANSNDEQVQTMVEDEGGPIIQMGQIGILDDSEAHKIGAFSDGDGQTQQYKLMIVQSDHPESQRMSEQYMQMQGQILLQDQQFHYQNTLSDNNSQLNTLQQPTAQSIWQNEKYYKVPRINGQNMSNSRTTQVGHTRTNSQYNNSMKESAGKPELGFDSQSAQFSKINNLASTSLPTSTRIREYMKDRENQRTKSFSKTTKMADTTANDRIQMLNKIQYSFQKTNNKRRLYSAAGNGNLVKYGSAASMRDQQINSSNKVGTQTTMGKRSRFRGGGPATSTAAGYQRQKGLAILDSETIQDGTYPEIAMAADQAQKIKLKGQIAGAQELINDLRELNQIQAGRTEGLPSRKSRKRYQFNENQSETLDSKVTQSVQKPTTMLANQIFVSINNNFLTPQNASSIQQDFISGEQSSRPYSMSSSIKDDSQIPKNNVISEYTVKKDFVTSDKGKIDTYNLQINDVEMNNQNIQPASGKDFKFGTTGPRPHFISMLRKAQIPQDIWAEFILKQDFFDSDQCNLTQAQQKEMLGRYQESKRKKKQQSQNQVLPPGTRKTFQKFTQDKMMHNVYEQANQALPQEMFSSVNLDPLSENSIKIADLIDDVASDPQKNMAAVKGKGIQGIKSMLGAQLRAQAQQKMDFTEQQLLYKKNMTMEETSLFKKRFNDLMNFMIDNMKEFDDNLKLKMQMSVDMVWQDQRIWFKQIGDYLRKEHNMPKDVADKLTEDKGQMPEYLRLQDKDMRVMIDKLHQIIAKIHIKPFHHAPESVADRNQLIVNIYQIKEDAALMVEDLKQVAECVNQLMQKQSISFIIHSKNKNGSSQDSEARRRPSLKVTEISQGKKKEHQLITDPVDQQKGQDQKTLYNQFLINQILQLVVLYLFAIINKHMEMLKLQQFRQKKMHEKQMDYFHEQVDYRFQDLQVLHNMALDRRDKKIEILEKQVLDQRKEINRLNNVVRQQQDDMKILCQTGDDVFEMAQKLYQADKTLDEIEKAGNASEQNIKSFKKVVEMINTIDKDIEDEEVTAAKKVLQSTITKSLGMAFQGIKMKKDIKTLEESLLAKQKKDKRHTVSYSKSSKKGRKTVGSALTDQNAKSGLESANELKISPRESNKGIKNMITEEAPEDESSESPDNKRSHIIKATPIWRNENVKCPHCKKLIDAVPNHAEGISKQNSSDKQLFTIAKNSVDLLGTPGMNKDLKLQKQATTTQKSHVSSPLNPLAISKQLTSKSKTHAPATPNDVDTVKSTKKKKATEIQKDEESSVVLLSKEGPKKLSPLITKFDSEAESPTQQNSVAFEAEHSVEIKNDNLFSANQPSEKVQTNIHISKTNQKKAITPKRTSKLVSSNPNSQMGKTSLVKQQTSDAYSKEPMSTLLKPEPCFEQIVHTDQSIKVDHIPSSNPGDSQPKKFIFESNQKKAHQDEFMSVTVRNQSKVVNDGIATSNYNMQNGSYRQGNSISPPRYTHGLLVQVTKQEQPPKPACKQYIRAPEVIPRTNVKITLPDSIMIRLLEVVVEELVVNDHLRQQELHPMTKWPRQMPLYRDYLYQFLQKQYGRNNLCYAYMREIENRLLEYAKDTNNEYAGTLLDLVQQKVIDVQNPNILPFNVGQGYNNSSSASMQKDEKVGDIRINLSHCKLQILNINTQRAIIYSIKVFQDAKNQSLHANAKFYDSVNQNVGVRNILKPHICESGIIMKNGGEIVSIFDIIQTFSVYEPLNELSLQIIGRLEPEHFLNLKDEELEEAGMLFLKMKIGYKLQQFSFDEDSFYKRLEKNISFKEKNRVDLKTLLKQLAETYNIYLSPLEQIALRNVIYKKSMKDGSLSADQIDSPLIYLRSPESTLRFFMAKTTSEDLKQSQARRQKAVYFDEMVQINEREFRENYDRFQINKSYFIRIVMSEWERFIDKKATLLEQAMKQEDQYLQRDALNFDQFYNVLHDYLHLNIKHAFGPLAYSFLKRAANCSYQQQSPQSVQTKEQLQHMFVDAVQHQESLELQQNSLVSFETVRDLILRSNCEILPFYQYIQTKLKK